MTCFCATVVSLQYYMIMMQQLGHYIFTWLWCSSFDVEYIYGFVMLGGLYGKLMTSPRTSQRNRHAWARTIVTSSVYECTVAVADVFYIFNSTVVDWTCFFYDGNMTCLWCSSCIITVLYDYGAAVVSLEHDIFMMQGLYLYSITWLWCSSCIFRRWHIYNEAVLSLG